MRKNPLRIFWIVLGFLCLGLGTVGVVLPYPSYSTLLHGHGVLLCEKLPESFTTGSLGPACIRNIWSLL